MLTSRIELPDELPSFSRPHLAALREKVARADAILREEAAKLEDLKTEAVWTLAGVPAPGTRLAVGLLLGLEVAHQVTSQVTRFEEEDLDRSDLLRQRIRAELWDVATRASRANQRDISRLVKEIDWGHALTGN